MTTRQQLEQQLVAAHRSGNVQAAQQAAYAIRAFDQNWLYAQVPSVNAPPPIERVPKPSFGDYFEDISRGMGRGFTNQLEGIGTMVEHPIETGKALYQAGVEAVRNPSQALGELWSGIKSSATRAISSPEGFGQVLGENLNIVRLPGGKRRPTQAELDVYHGTPHTFEPEAGAPLGRFRSEKIGTGEGAQVYGYGLYLAESPGVAKEYQIKLSSTGGAKNKVAQHGDVDSAIEATQRNISNYRSAIASGVGGERLKGMLQIAEKNLSDLQDMKSGKPAREGSLYKVDLPDAKIEQMLDWDKPLKEQPKEVRQALTRLAQNAAQSDEQLMKEFQKLGASATGDMLYATLVQRAVRLKKYEGMRAGIPEDKAMPSLTYGQQIASEQLRQAGIPGIKYLDAGSRDGGKGTRNFVVFPGEEQHLTILERDGVKAAPKPTTWQGMSRKEFLGDPKITTNRNAADLKPRALTTVVTEQPKPFKGNLTIRMNEDGAAVYDGDKVIASYNFGDTLVVDKKYRKQGIGEELVYQWRKANPTAPPATERTKASQAIQEKVWQRLLNEQG